MNQPGRRVRGGGGRGGENRDRIERRGHDQTGHVGRVDEVVHG